MKSVRFRLASVILAAAAGTLAAGCSDDDDDDVFFGPTDQGQLEVFVADAPPEFARLQQVNTTITRVEAVGAVDTATAPSLVVPLFVGSRQVDLLELRGGQRELIGQGNVPVGIYDRIRVYFSDATIQYDSEGADDTYSTQNGRLTFAGLGQAQPGVAVVEFDLPGDGVLVSVAETEQVLVDVDLEESIDVQGDVVNPTSMTISPQGRVLILGEEAGSIRGVIRGDAGTPANAADDTPVNGAEVTLLDAESNVVTVKRTDAQGVYVLEGIEPGQYQLQAAAEGFTTTQTDVVVEANQQTTADLLLVDTTP